MNTLVTFVDAATGEEIEHIDYDDKTRLWRIRSTGESCANKTHLVRILQTMYQYRQRKVEVK